MIVKILGMIDLFAVIAMVLSESLPSRFLIIAAVVLAVKGLLFLLMGNRVSIADVAAGAYIWQVGIHHAFSANAFLSFLSWLIGIYLFQKAFFSLGAR
ncbi:MAG: hypothetical protein NTV63_05545 [Candidatus Woesearchaeota archaeon]|nr:hypothetical protein [Candidatus Woesearchaeota archaeon]